MRISKRNRPLSRYASMLERLELRTLLSAAFDITGLTAMRANSAFSNINGGGVGIAVLDTGVDAANPDLSANVKAFYNAVENPVSTSNVSPSNAVDHDGHGSHVSGIAASSNSSIGVAYDASLVDIKVIADAGESQLGGDPVLRGLQWVANNYLTYNIKVVNMSLGEAGVNDNSVTAADAAAAEAVEIKALQKLGITVVSASGNSYANNPTPGESFPAIVSTIGVANTWATTGQASDFGVPFGESGDQYYAIDYSATPDTLASTSQRSTVNNQLAAPGEDIYSTWNGTVDSSNGNDVLHNTISGTSMATPFVSGVVALMQQAAKYFGGHYLSDPSQILQILTQTADTIVDSNNPNNARYNSNTGATSNLPETGLSFKRVDVLKAIEEVRTLVTGGSITVGPAPGPDQDNATTTATPVNGIEGTTVYTFGGSIGTDGLVEVGNNDVDLFKLDVVSPGQMTFALSQPTGGTSFAAALRLFDSSGNVVASTVGTSSAYPTLTTSGALAVGTYYLGVSSAGNQSYTINGTGAANGSAGGDYSLQITLMNPDPNGTIQGAVSVDLTSPNQILTDPNTGAQYTAVAEQGLLGSDPPPIGSTTRIKVSSDVDMFKVNAPDTGTLTLTTESDLFSGDMTYLGVYDSSGNKLASSTGSTSENILSYNVTSGTTYYVAVTIPGNSGLNPTNPYQGRIPNGTPTDQSYTLYFRFDNGDTNGTAINALPENIGTPISGSIGTDNGVTVGANGSKDVDWFNYTAGSDGLLNISAQGSTTGFTPVITLWTYGNGNNIVKLADTSSSSLFASAASAFAPSAATSSLAAGTAQLTYEVGAGQSYFVAITGQGNSNFNWYALASGTGGATGNYTLSTTMQSLTALKALNDNSIENGTPGSITLGQTINANLGADGSLVVGSDDVDLYKFVATTTGQIDVRTFTGQEGDADTVLRIFNSSGTQLGSNDNISAMTTASEVKINVVAGQTYYIGVSGAGPNALSYDPVTGANAGAGSTGNYSLSVTMVAPGFSVSNPAPVSAVTGATMVFTVTLDQPLSASATVDYATSDGTAVAGTDYTATSGTLTFPAGTTSQTISVPVLAAPSGATGTRTFTLTLSNASGAPLGNAVATGTIDETPVVTQPAASLSTPAPALAYTGGNLVFNVTLDQASASPVTIDYSTVDGTALAGTDYTATPGTLTFAPGTVTQTITVPVLVNTTAPTGTVTFTLQLSNPNGATLSTASTAGSIQDLPVTTVNFSSNHPARYTDSAGKAVQLLLKGPGSGAALFVNGALDPARISLSNTTPASTFTIRTTGATIGDISVSGSLRAIDAPSTNLDGSLTVSGSLANLTLATATGTAGGGVISIGGAAIPLVAKIGAVTDESLSTAGAIASLKVADWTDTASNTSTLSATRIDAIVSTGSFAVSIAATALGSVKIGGSLTAGTWSIDKGAREITVAGAATSSWSATFGGALDKVRLGSDAGSLTAGSINRLTITGAMTGADLNLTGSGATLATLSVGQTVSNSQIRSAGNIGKVTVGAFLDSDLFAGVSSTVTALPTATSDFTANDSILSFSVSGKGGTLFSNSNIAAESIGKVLLARVDSNNGGMPFGVATESLDAFTNRGVLKWTKKQPASALTPDGDLVVRLLT